MTVDREFWPKGTWRTGVPPDNRPYLTRCGEDDEAWVFYRCYSNGRWWAGANEKIHAIANHDRGKITSRNITHWLCEGPELPTKPGLYVGSVSGTPGSYYSWWYGDGSGWSYVSALKEDVDDGKGGGFRHTTSRHPDSYLTNWKSVHLDVPQKKYPTRSGIYNVGSQFPPTYFSWWFNDQEKWGPICTSRSDAERRATPTFDRAYSSTTYWADCPPLPASTPQCPPPSHVGVYQVMTSKGQRYSYWDGKRWCSRCITPGNAYKYRDRAANGPVLDWRGEPYHPGTEKLKRKSGWYQYCGYKSYWNGEFWSDSDVDHSNARRMAAERQRESMLLERFENESTYIGPSLPDDEPKIEVREVAPPRKAAEKLPLPRRTAVADRRKLLLIN